MKRWLTCSILDKSGQPQVNKSLMSTRARKVSMIRYLLITPMFLLGMQAARGADNQCALNAFSIVQQAYPSAKVTSDAAVGATFNVGGATITLPITNPIESQPHVVVCRSWPAHPELTLAAIPLITKQSNYGSDGDLELLVLDSASLKVKQRLFLPGRMDDNWLRISTVAFDTARYKLASGQTAFGLRIQRANNSSPNPMKESVLWLYVVENSQLRPVLDGVVMQDNRGEWDVLCAGIVNETNRTLSMASGAHNGYADILVSEKASSRTATVIDGEHGDCDARQPLSSRSTFRLIYNGRRYDVPKALKPMD
jgi:hypothetical protein